MPFDPSTAKQDFGPSTATLDSPPVSAIDPSTVAESDIPVSDFDPSTAKPDVATNKDIPDTIIRSAPNEGIFHAILRNTREALSPIIGPTETQQAMREQDKRNLARQFPQIASVAEETGGSEIEKKGLLAGMMTNKSPWALTVNGEEAVREKGNPLTEALLAPSEKSDPTSLKIAQAIYTPIAHTLNALTSPVGLMTAGIGSGAGTITAAKSGFATVAPDFIGATKLGGESAPLLKQVEGAVAGIFATDMGRGVVESLPDAYAKWTNPKASTKDKIQASVEITLNMAMASMAAHGAYSGLKPSDVVGKRPTEAIKVMAESSGKTVDEVAADVHSKFEEIVGQREGVKPLDDRIENAARQTDPTSADAKQVKDSWYEEQKRKGNDGVLPTYEDLRKTAEQLFNPKPVATETTANPSETAFDPSTAKPDIEGGAPAYEKVDIGKRSESVSTGTGVETDAEKAMMAQPETTFDASTAKPDTAIDSSIVQPDTSTTDTSKSKDVTIENKILAEQDNEFTPVGLGAATAAEMTPKPSITRIRNADIDAHRVSRGLPPLMDSLRRSWGAVWDQAMQRIDDFSNRGEDAANEIIARQLDKPEQLTDVDQAILLHRRTDLKIQYEKVAERLIEGHEIGSEVTLAADRIRRVQLEDQLQDLEQANKVGGTETARGLNARKMAIREDYSLVSMRLRKRAGKDGAPLTEEEGAEVEAAHKKIVKAQDELDLHTEEKGNAEGEVAADKAVGELKKKVAKEGNQDSFDLEKEKEGIIEKLKDGAMEDLPLSDFRGLIQKLALHFVREGVTERGALVDAVHGVVKDIIPGIEHSETRDLISGYGDFKPLDPDADKATLRDLKGQLQQVAKLDAMQKGRAPDKTGMERRTLSDEERRLVKQVNEMKRKGGFIVTDPAKQLKTALESIKTRLTNQIADLQQQIDTKTRIVKTNTKVVPDAEVIELTKQRDALKEKFDQIFTKPELTDAQRLAMAEKSADRQITELERQIRNQEVFPAGKMPEQKSAALDAKRARIEALKEERQYIRESLQPPEDPKTAAESNATRLTKQIEEIERQLKDRDIFPAGKKPRESFAENAALEARLKALKEEREFARQSLQPSADPKSDVDRVEDRIKEIERQIKEGDIFPKGKKPTPDSPELKEANERLKAAKESREWLRQSLQPRADPKTDIETKTAQLDKQIKTIEDQIKNREVFTKGKKEPVTSPEIEAQKKQLDELRQRRDALRDEIQPNRVNDRRLGALKTSLANRIADYQERLANRDFGPRPKRIPIEMDSAAERLKAAATRAKQEFDTALLKDRLANRPMLQKMKDTFVKYQRGFLLSGPVTLVKLTAAAAFRMGANVAEEGIGAGVSKLIPGVAKRAPREGGLSLKAEAKSITSALTQGMRDAAQTLKTGKSNLEVNYGKGADGVVRESDVLPRSWIDFFGALHGALKAPVKRAEFERSLQKRIEFYLKNNADVSDPAVQVKAMLETFKREAYKDAARSIFLQDNILVDGINSFIARLEQPAKGTGKPSPSGTVAAGVARGLFPIVRVPMNIVAETVQYATGLVTGSARLGLALRKGLENLTPEQADLIMRDLKKGIIGTAALVIGYLNADSIGGYYTGDKTKPGAAKFGTIKLFGVNVPSFLLHSPLLEALQIGATIRHVLDHKIRGADQSLGSAAWIAAIGLADETPFGHGAATVAKLLDPRETNKAWGEIIKSSVVPQTLSFTAEQLDRDARGVIPRKTEGILDSIQSGIPVLRPQLPVDQRKANRRPSAFNEMITPQSNSLNGMGIGGPPMSQLQEPVMNAGQQVLAKAAKPPVLANIVSQTASQIGKSPASIQSAANQLLGVPKLATIAEVVSGSRQQKASA